MGKFEYGFILENNIVSELNVWRVITVVMVNFMHQFHWAKDAKIAGKTLFLGVSVKVFLEELAI